MPLQNIAPLNPTLMDTLVKHSDTEGWYPDPNDPERSFTKVLWAGHESGRLAVLFRWLKGFQAPPHKHIGASHTWIIKGKLKVRDATLEAGDYVYEPNGMIHGATTALEDTEYLFIMEGAILFFDDDGILGYESWEEYIRQSQTVPHLGERRV